MKRHKCKGVDMIRVENGTLKRYCNTEKNFLQPEQYCKGKKIKETDIINAIDAQWLKFARLPSKKGETKPPIRIESDDLFLVCDGYTVMGDGNSHDEIVCGGAGTIRIQDGETVYSVRLLLE